MLVSWAINWMDSIPSGIPEGFQVAELQLKVRHGDSAATPHRKKKKRTTPLPGMICILYPAQVVRTVCIQTKWPVMVGLKYQGVGGVLRMRGVVSRSLQTKNSSS